MGVRRCMDVHHDLLLRVHGHCLEPDQSHHLTWRLWRSIDLQYRMESGVFQSARYRNGLIDHLLFNTVDLDKDLPIPKANERLEPLTPSLLHLVGYRYFVEPLLPDVQLI